jgi:4-hydroxybenzoate polyprenyltransferase
MVAERARLAGDVVRLLRPAHWLKNAFVLLPVPFALAAGARLEPATFAAGFAGFCLLASAVYAWNDVRDAQADRASRRRSRRPVASGALSPGAATAAGAAALLGAAALAAATGLPRVGALFGTYLALNAAYSLGAKHVPLLDVFLVASGFVLRVLVGCALVQAPPSDWLLLCSSALALFLAFAKRRGDMLEGVGAAERPSLAGYSERFLEAAMGISAGIALLAYALYCASAAVLVPGRELAGVPFAAYGVLETLRLAFTTGAGAGPVELALGHRPLQVCGALWALATAWSLGLV